MCKSLEETRAEKKGKMGEIFEEKKKQDPPVTKGSWFDQPATSAGADHKQPSTSKEVSTSKRKLRGFDLNAPL